jgi:hypothetical protein
MHLSYLFILILWIAVVAFWWNTRQQIEELRRQVDELASRLRDEPTRP